jgi:hypothetical protein
VPFSLQIVIQEIPRPEAFDIPLVKVFVAEEAHKVSVCIIVTRHEALSWQHRCLGIEMFKAAT